MRFADIRGNANVVDALRRMADSGRVPHAIMFHENEGGGALAMVQAFMQYLNCRNHTGGGVNMLGETEPGDSCGICPSCNQTSKFIHPDIRYTFPISSGSKVSGEVSKLTCTDYAPYWRELVTANTYFIESELSSALGIEKKSAGIAIAEGRAIAQKLSLSAVSGEYRAIVIYLPEKMNIQTANFLLKALEEPAERTLFLLITHAPEDVLQTISSRCLPIRIAPFSPDEVADVLVRQFAVEQSQASELASVAEGSVGEALYLRSEQKEREELSRLFADLMDRITARDLGGALDVGEDLAALDSREKQKAFCTFAGVCLRKIFMLQQNMGSIAGVAPSEDAYYGRLASVCGSTFCKRSMVWLGRAARLLERNVNQKMVFCNLVSRMFVSI